MALVFSRSGTINADTQWELDALDLSCCKRILMECRITAAPGSDATRTLKIRLQDRRHSNIWSDRLALAQIDGSMDDEKLVRGHLSSEPGYGSDTYEPSGSSGGSRLDPDNAVHGPFPPRYRNPGVGTETAWRVDFDVDGSSPSFAVEINIYAE